MQSSSEELPGLAVTNKLTQKAVKALLQEAVASGKPRRLADGGGLLLEARPNGRLVAIALLA